MLKIKKEKRLNIEIRPKKKCDADQTSNLLLLVGYKCTTTMGKGRTWILSPRREPNLGLTQCEMVSSLLETFQFTWIY